MTTARLSVGRDKSAALAVGRLFALDPKDQVGAA